MQLGGVGLFLFLFLMSMEIASSLKMPKPNRWVLQGVVVSMAIGCLLNSFLYDSLQGHYFAFISAVLLAAPQSKSLDFKGNSERHQNKTQVPLSE